MTHGIEGVHNARGMGAPSGIAHQKLMLDNMIKNMGVQGLVRPLYAHICLYYCIYTYTSRSGTPSPRHSTPCLD